MGLRRSDSDCHHWRPDLGFSPAGAISFHYGKGRRLQSSQAARCWIDNGGSIAYRWNCRCNFRLAHKTSRRPACHACDNQHFCVGADRCHRARALASPRNQLSRIPDRHRAVNHAHWPCALLFYFRTNASRRISFSNPGKTCERR